jgi:uncharacterized protein YjaZ
MSSINHYIANAAHELTRLIPLIEESLKIVVPVIESELKAKEIDIIFVSAANQAIPEYGLGGNSPGPNHIYISFDPESQKITKQGLVESLFHEAHHCMRWRNPGYGETLGEAMISEGLACLYEEEHGGLAPIYAKVDISQKEIESADKELNSTKYSHAEWFFGTGKIKRWFGYTYGYELCKRYSLNTGLSSADLLHVSASEILNQK